ncbi:MAG: hypothetical protein OEU50_03125 [Gammaproteobacteria bacterium]|nr:hypothetical protein [Gammaproteobacteria bacterium]
MSAVKNCSDSGLLADNRFEKGLSFFKSKSIRFMHRIFSAFKEKRFAKRVIHHLLDKHSAVSAENPDLSGKELYREILLRTQQIDPLHVDRMLQQAEDSIDRWTASGRDGLGFREVAHYFTLTQFQATGQKGTVVSFEQIVNALIPAHL